MVAESVQSFEALESQAAILLDVFKTAGYEQVAPSIIQPADVFLNTRGMSLSSSISAKQLVAASNIILAPYSKSKAQLIQTQ